MPKILCFGDSITYGAWDPEGGWVTRLRKQIDAICMESKLSKFFLTYNLGVSSDTSESLLKRFDGEVLARMIEEGEPIIIFSIGTNDSVRYTDTHEAWVSEDIFAKNIEELIKRAVRYTSRILFLGSIPVNEAKTNPYLNDSTIESNNADIKKYDNIIAEKCQKSGVEFIPIFKSLVKTSFAEMLYEDGVHPNETGHAFLAAKVWEYINAEGWLE